MVTPYFYQRDGQNLFGLYFSPEVPRSQAFVLCNGFGAEGEDGRVFLSQCGRVLASRGYPALRFDYFGFEDSDGETEEADIESMCADIERSVDELKAKTKASRVGLIGMRLGATLAALVAFRRDDIDDLILWEPLIKPFDSLYTDLRATVVMQTVLFRGVRYTRDEIVENTMAGRPSLAERYNLNVVHDGFRLGSRFLRQIRDIDLLATAPRRIPRTLVLNIRRDQRAASQPIAQFVETLQALGGDCALEIATEPCLPWAPAPTLSAVVTTAASDAGEKTLYWLEN